MIPIVWLLCEPDTILISLLAAQEHAIDSTDQALLCSRKKATLETVLVIIDTLETIRYIETFKRLALRDQVF